MNALKQIFENLRTMMREMSAMQRASIMTFIVTVALLLAFVVYLSSLGRREIEIALPLRVAPSDANELINKLTGEGCGPVTYDVDKEEIRIPMDKRDKAIRFLAAQKLLPRDAASGFEKMLKTVSFSDTQVITEEKMRVALQNEIGWMIEGMEGVKEARVVYTDGGPASLFRPQFKRRATVKVTMELGKNLDQEMAESIIRLVAYARAGLDEQDVYVTDQKGNHFHIRDTKEMNYLSAAKIKQQEEMNERLRRKVEELIRHAIPNSEAFAFIDTKFDFTEETTYRKEMLQGVVTRNIAEKQSKKTEEGPAAEAGTRPNVARASESSGGGRYAKTDFNRKSSDVIREPGFTEVRRKKDPEVKSITVSAIVHLPYQTIVNEKGEYEYLKDDKGNLILDPVTKLPITKKIPMPKLTDEQIQELENNILLAVGMVPGQETVKNVNIQQVQWTPPLEPPPPPPPATTQVREFLEQKFVPLLLLGVVVVVIGMLISQAKRAIPPEMEEEEEVKIPAVPPLTEIEQANADFEALRSQLSELIEENPTRAATLIRRWMTAREGY